MCGGPMVSEKPHEKLARLMERELGYSSGHISPVALRLFLHAYWDRVKALAHAIHDDK